MSSLVILIAASVLRYRVKKTDIQMEVPLKSRYTTAIAVDMVTRLLSNVVACSYAKNYMKTYRAYVFLTFSRLRDQDIIAKLYNNG